ncbi:MAG: ECF transporter S component [Pseudanabaena sp. ELA607]|jgi:hypothetical protein
MDRNFAPNFVPKGEERKIQTLSGAMIDGSPIAYIVVLAAIVTALTFIPFSIVLSSGGAMPLSQAILPLMGWLLGPIAGAVVSGIGALIGIFLVPYTAGIPMLTIGGTMLTSFIAGTMVLGKKRRYWWLGITVISIISLLIYANRALNQNGISYHTFVLGAFIDWSSLVLFILPTRNLFAKLIHSNNLLWVSIGLFGGTWMISGLTHANIVAITYTLFNWPEAVWLALIPIIPLENLARSVVGVVIGVGVISGLRAIGLVKPTEAIY